MSNTIDATERVKKSANALFTIDETSVEQLQNKLSHMSLTHYHCVILMVGGCNLYDKQAQRLSPPADVACQLESLCLKVGSLITGHVLLDMWHLLNLI